MGWPVCANPAGDRAGRAGAWPHARYVDRKPPVGSTREPLGGRPGRAGARQMARSFQLLGPDEVQPPHYVEGRPAPLNGTVHLNPAAEGAPESAGAALGVAEQPEVFHFVVPGNGSPEALARARDAVVRWLDGQISDVVAADLKLIVSELVTNALQAAATGIRVTAEGREGHIEVRVHDDAAGWPRPLAPSATENHGRGLQIVAALAARWGVTADPDGKTVWAEIAVPA